MMDDNCPKFLYTRGGEVEWGGEGGALKNLWWKGEEESGGEGGALKNLRWKGGSKVGRGLGTTGLRIVAAFGLAYRGLLNTGL